MDLESLQGGTFTITNIGPLGGIALAPAINYPEVAILGMGRATDKPVVRGGEIVVRRMLPLALSFDHRVTDGLVKVLSDPETGLVLGVGIVGVSASELIAEATLALEMGATLEDLMVTIHPHPTLSESLMEAAEVAAGAPIHLLPTRKRS